MQIPNQGTGSVEARLGDFDLKSGNGGELESWRRKERELVEEGWYMCEDDGSSGSDDVCLLSMRT